MRGLRCLSSDEAAFVRAACARVLDLGDSRCAELAGSAAAAYVDRKLSGGTKRVDDESCGNAVCPSVLYRAGIAAVQSHCLHMHDARFQELTPNTQYAILAILEESTSLEAIGEFRMLTSMIVVDAVEAFFELSDIRRGSLLPNEFEKQPDYPGFRTGSSARPEQALREEGAKPAERSLSNDAERMPMMAARSAS